ncbi:MAG: hypothetical protein ACKO28_10455 [Cyanobium sp.]
MVGLLPLVGNLHLLRYWLSVERAVVAVVVGSALQQLPLHPMHVLSGASCTGEPFHKGPAVRCLGQQRRKPRNDPAQDPAML